MSNRFYCHFRPILKGTWVKPGGKRGTDCGLTRFAPSSDFSARQLWSFATVQGQIMSNKLLMNYIKTVANLDQLSWQFKCALHISVYCSLVGKACDSTYLYSALQCNIPQMATTCNNKCCNMSQSLHSNGWILDLLRQASTTDPVAVAFALPLPGVASPWPGWTDRLGKSEQALGIIGICLKSVFLFFGSAPCLNMRSY